MCYAYIVLCAMHVVRVRICVRTEEVEVMDGCALPEPVREVSYLVPPITHALTCVRRGRAVSCFAQALREC